MFPSLEVKVSARRAPEPSAEAEFCGGSGARPRGQAHTKPELIPSINSSRKRVKSPDRIACLTRRMVSRKNARLWCDMRTAASISPAGNRCRMYARECLRQTAHAHASSRGRASATLRVLNVQSSARGESLTVAAVARREDAVEHIDPARDTLDQVFRRADTHQVSRPRVGHARRDVSMISSITGFSSPTLRPPIA